MNPVEAEIIAERDPRRSLARRDVQWWNSAWSHLTTAIDPRLATTTWLGRMTRLPGLLYLFWVVAVGAIATTCSSPTPIPPEVSTAASTLVSLPIPARSPLDVLLEATATNRSLAASEDTIEVWICQVPADTTHSWYTGLDGRLDLTPSDVTRKLNESVGPYFERLSHNRYAPRFIEGATVAMAPNDTPNDCVDRALDASEPSSRGVFAVADAEHRAVVPGGWGRPGVDCTVGPSSPCDARTTRRAAYIGASDFHPDWGPVPAVDLAEHEVGHMIGWPHSGAIDGDGHDSAIDVMSNSAAPRDTDPERRDGPGTLAINRLTAGWIDRADVVTFDPSSEPRSVTLSPSHAASGTRLVTLDVDDQRFLTVEFIVADGFNSHLTNGGIAIHVVDPTGHDCTTESTDGDCSGPRVNVARHGSAPFDSLMRTGEEWSGEGWTVSVESVDSVSSTATIRLGPTATDG